MRILDDGFWKWLGDSASAVGIRWDEQIQSEQLNQADRSEQRMIRSITMPTQNNVRTTAMNIA
jgi:hypothetical protein